MEIQRKKLPQPPRNKFRIGLIIVLVVAGLIFLGLSRFNPLPNVVSTYIVPKTTEDYPDVDLTKLSPQQQDIIRITKQEFKDQPKGTKYSEGTEEAWCADFVSWVMNEVHAPYKNPHSGSWRIPGTFTLREYYESIGTFRAADSGYEPKIGDTMLYDNPSPFGQHVNIIIKVDNGIVTTIGGNEPGGIRVITHEKTEKPGFIGYGSL